MTSEHKLDSVDSSRSNIVVKKPQESQCQTGDSHESIKPTDL